MTTVIKVLGPPGCVDSQTEFFNGKEWKPISLWDNDKVLQYNPETDSGELVVPERYIVQPCKEFYHIKTKYGIDQMLSPCHNMAYFLPRKNLKIHKKSFQEIYEQHEKSKHGFNGKIKTAFKYTEGKGINLTDDEIRLMLVVSADGTLDRGSCVVSLKKERKICYLELLLTKMLYNYTKTYSSGYTRFRFKPPIYTKEFPSEWYNMTLEQLQVVRDDIAFWDGCYNNSNIRYATIIKSNADFVQFAFAADNQHASISIDNRTTPCYTVLVSKNIFTGFGKCGDYKRDIPKVPSIDGKMYCFTVPSGYLILRRSNNIFITGNCGKTTFLLSRFRECLSYTCIDKIGYFSFSKQAAYEALERAAKHIELEGSDRLVFSTLHSFAYRLLDLRQEDVFNNKHERVFSAKMGLKRQWDNDQGVFATTKDDRIAALVKYATVTNTPVEVAWKEFAYELPWLEVKRYVDGLNEYKKLYNLLDFNDMILRSMDADNIPEFDYLFIDECQDTSKIQWDFIRQKLMPRTKVLYLVGDDDQTIFNFAGASSKDFVEFPCDEMICLDQSYRVPQKVQEIADRVISRVDHRIPKNWKPRKDSGNDESVKFAPNILSLKELMRKKGSWLILARDNYILGQTRKMLRAAGIYYAERIKNFGVRTAEAWVPALPKEVFQAAHTYWTFKQLGFVSTEGFIAMLKYMNKSELAAEIQDEPIIDETNCPAEILKMIKTETAFNALKGISQRDLDYLWALYMNNEIDDNFILKPPRIRLATIHAVKGSECSNVVLLTDISPQSHYGLNHKNRYDEELRIIYVGLTRARDCLWIVKPQTKYNFIAELYKHKIERRKDG